MYGIGQCCLSRFRCCCCFSFAVLYHWKMRSIEKIQCLIWFTFSRKSYKIICVCMSLSRYFLWLSSPPFLHTHTDTCGDWNCTWYISVHAYRKFKQLIRFAAYAHTHAYYTSFAYVLVCGCVWICDGTVALPHTSFIYYTNVRLLDTHAHVSYILRGHYRLGVCIHIENWRRLKNHVKIVWKIYWKHTVSFWEWSDIRKKQTNKHSVRSWI